MTYVRKSKLT